MKQYFYIVVHKSKCGFCLDKVFLQERDAIKWGRTLATKFPSYQVELYRQEITRAGTCHFYKNMLPF